MNVSVYNAALLIGWLLVTLGGLLISPGAGLIGGGLLLLALVFAVARLAGVYQPTEKPEID